MAPESINALTKYVVLGVYENEWTVAGHFAARDGNSAIKAAVEKNELPARIGHTDTFVAVPARSWQPVKVTKKVETTLVLEEAKS